MYPNSVYSLRMSSSKLHKPKEKGVAHILLHPFSSSPPAHSVLPSQGTAHVLPVLHFIRCGTQVATTANIIIHTIIVKN